MHKPLHVQDYFCNYIFITLLTLQSELNIMRVKKKTHIDKL